LDIGFLKNLDPIIIELELYLKDLLGTNFKFQDIGFIKDLILLRATITGRGLDKNLLIVKDNKRKLMWEIRVKNLFNINSSGRRRKYEAYYNYTYL